MATDYHLRVVCVQDLTWKSKHFHSRKPNLYVTVKLGDTEVRSSTIKRNSAPTWNEFLSLSSPDVSSTIHVELMHQPSDGEARCFGWIDIQLSRLLQECAKDGVTRLSLQAPVGEASTTHANVLHVHIEDAVASARKHIALIDSGSNFASQEGGLYQSIGNLLAKLDVFVDVVDILSEAHPYLQLAWQVTSAMYRVVSNQFKCDKKVVDLVDCMEEAFDFVDEIGSLRFKTPRPQKVIVRLLQQTAECCLFVQDYSRRPFAKRVLDMSKAKLDSFEQSFAALKRSLDSGVVCSVAFISTRLTDKVDTLILSNRLQPVEMNAYGRPQCLPGTRVELLSQLRDLLLSGADQNIVWLNGVAGSGKSTISTTIAEYFRAMSRLGAFLFFERGKSHPKSVIPTLAYKLASFDAQIAKHVVAAVEQGNDIAEASGASQFEELLSVPLHAAADDIVGPIIIILDALDECGDEQSRWELMQLIQEEFPQLPKNFRFLITSRKESDIDDSLSCRPHSIREIRLDSGSQSSQEDVLSFITSKMDEVVRVRKKIPVPPSWPWDANMALLGKAAEGLFVWASTAVKLVNGSIDPFRKLNELVSCAQLPNGFNLSNLYRNVLLNLESTWSDSISTAHFQRVLSLILFSKVPLTIADIDGILGLEPTSSSVQLLSRLQSVLVYSHEGPVRLLHTSFSDYLLAEERSGDPWFIDIPTQKSMLTARCFAVMNRLLRFNICCIESSYLPNERIAGLPDRIRECIPSHLSYACLFWSHHLREALFSPALLSALMDLLCVHLLSWLEVLSFLKKVNRAYPILSDAVQWVGTRNTEATSLLKDASTIFTRFAECIAHSAPHIYVSVLAFMPEQSKLSAHYLQRAISLVRVESKGNRRRPQLLKEIRGHTDDVRSVAFSPDGTRVASGSADKAIRIWDAQTGELVSGPFEGHTDWINSVAISPDGTRVVSGSCDATVRIWDAHTGELVHGPFEGHAGCVSSVEFSSDGTRVASGSSDRTVRIWDAHTGELISGPFGGHADNVNSIAISPDGARVASGSADKTVRIWYAQTGELVSGPFEGHTSSVESVAFSPDGTRIASGSSDQTVRIWDAQTGELISGPFEGHASGVTSVTFSPDGSRVASGSEGRTVRIWDAQTGELVSGPFEGHASGVTSVTFSLDGSRVASGSYDKTIRIWDANSGEIIPSSFDGHTDYIWSVAFSHDGSRITSGSADNTICVWDANTGELVKGPLKGHTDCVWSVAFSPDGARIVSGAKDKTIRVWDTWTGELVCGSFEGHAESVESVAFSPDGLRVASGSADKTVRVWDANTGKLISGPFEGHTDCVWSVAFSPDGARIVSGSKDKSIRVWDTRTGELVCGSFEGHAEAVESVAFSPDGVRIASGSADKTICIWDSQTGDLLSGPFEGHTGWVRSVAFSSDGSRVVSSSGDKTVRIWDVQTGELVSGPFEGHSGMVYSVAFSSDGTRVASGSLDKTIRITDASWHSSKTCEGLLYRSSFVLDQDALSNWTLSEDGWAIGKHDELLLWVPPELRPTLWRAETVALFSCEFSTKLDFTHAARGESWQECYNPR